MANTQRTEQHGFDSSYRLRFALLSLTGLLLASFPEFSPRSSRLCRRTRFSRDSTSVDNQRAYLFSTTSSRSAMTGGLNWVCCEGRMVGEERKSSSDKRRRTAATMRMVPQAHSRLLPVSAGFTRIGADQTKQSELSTITTRPDLLDESTGVEVPSAQGTRWSVWHPEYRRGHARWTIRYSAHGWC